MHVTFRPDHTWPSFFKRTIAAQIHLVGCIVASVGLGALIAFSSRAGTTPDVVACIVFGLTAMLVFAVSSLYHFLHDGLSISTRLDDIFENLDHISIYSFIAGTYTAFLINAITSGWQTPLIAAVWVIAVVGMLYTGFRSRLPLWLQSRAVYTGLFIILGWTMVIRIGEIGTNLTRGRLALLLGGGAAYTIGALCYATRRPRLFPNVFGFHELWHAFVLLGFTLHYAMIIGFYV